MYCIGILWNLITDVGRRVETSSDGRRGWSPLPAILSGKWVKYGEKYSFLEIWMSDVTLSYSRLIPQMVLRNCALNLRSVCRFGFLEVGAEGGGIKYFTSPQLKS